MTNLPASPLAAIVGRAAKSLPSAGPVAARQKRLNSGSGTVLLCDTSSSMSELARGTRRKIDLLREAVEQIDAPHQLICFATSIGHVNTLPEPSGTTAMHLAIAHASSLGPAMTLLLTDGHPDDADATLRAVDALTGHLQAIYIGPESDTDAIDFLRRLVSRAAAGTVTVSPLTTQPLLPTLRRLLHA